MRIILTEDELSQAIRAHYPVPAEYAIEDVTISRHSVNFCTISLEKPAAPVELKAVEAEQAALRA